jgi:hypothetical protein
LHIQHFSRSYDGYIMMSRTQISLDSELQRRARRKAGDQGISLAEYVRQLIARDLGGTAVAVDRSVVFDLGSSGGSNIARNKDAMIAAAISQLHSRPQPARRSR